MKEYGERWFIPAVVACSLFIHWIYEPESRSVTNALLIIGIAAGLFVLLESLHVVARAMRRRSDKYR
jgi:hypothetical protein